MVLGEPRQAHQRTQSLHFLSSFINRSTIACCSSAQTPSSLSNAWTLDKLRTRRRVGSTRRRGNHMHDHSRFQRFCTDKYRSTSKGGGGGGGRGAKQRGRTHLEQGIDGHQCDRNHLTNIHTWTPPQCLELRGSALGRLRTNTAQNTYWRNGANQSVKSNPGLRIEAGWYEADRIRIRIEPPHAFDCWKRAKRIKPYP